MIITYEDIARIRRDNPGKSLVILKGTFDLFHFGHVNMLRRARALGDILVVLVKCDEAVRLKGNDRPIIDEYQRAVIVDSSKYVDYTLIANRKIDAGLKNVPDSEMNEYLRYYKLIEILRPDVLIKPDKKLPDVLMNLYEQIGTEIHEVAETPGVSTTYLINKIRGVKKKEIHTRVGIGQDTHKFDFSGNSQKPLILGGVTFEGTPLEANSDGDVILHAITRAISGITTKQVIGPKTKIFLADGITDSKIYLNEALKDLDGKIIHVSISVECKTPKITPRIPEIQNSLAELLKIKPENVGITATSGEEMNEAARGNGINVLAVVTVE